jgi:hypothetical protein
MSDTKEDPYDTLARLSIDRGRKVENIKNIKHEIDTLVKQLKEKEAAHNQEVNAKVVIEGAMAKVAAELK